MRQGSWEGATGDAYTRVGLHVSENGETSTRFAGSDAHFMTYVEANKW